MLAVPRVLVITESVNKSESNRNTPAIKTYFILPRNNSKLRPSYFFHCTKNAETSNAKKPATQRSVTVSFNMLLGCLFFFMLCPYNSVFAESELSSCFVFARDSAYTSRLISFLVIFH